MSKLKYYSQKDIPREFIIRNDKIKNIKLPISRNCMSIQLEYKSGEQGVGSGFNETHNIGNILLCYADLFEIDTDDCEDIIKYLKGMPIRVAYKFEFGGFTVDNTYLGNYMEDKWIYLKELFGRK